MNIKSKVSKRGVSALLGAALLLPLAACASTGEGGEASEPVASNYSCEAPNADTITKISISGMPIMTNMAMYAGIDEGFFSKHGLDPTIEVVSGSAATIASVVGGHSDFAYGVVSNLLQAVSSGQDLKAVAPFAGVEHGFVEKMEAGEPGYEKGVNAFLVSEDIKSAKDLEGKVVSVRDPVWSATLVKEFLDMNGVDVDKVEFVTLDPSAGYNALLAGQVAGVNSLEPFIAGWENEAVHNLGWLELISLETGANSVMFTSDKFTKENPETVARFVCAIQESSAFANENPDPVRAVMAREQGVDPAKYEDALVPHFFTEIEPSSYERIAEIMAKWGALENELPFESYYYAPTLK